MTDKKPQHLIFLFVLSAILAGCSSTIERHEQEIEQTIDRYNELLKTQQEARTKSTDSHKITVP